MSLALLACITSCLPFAVLSWLGFVWFSFSFHHVSSRLITFTNVACLMKRINIRLEQTPTLVLFVEQTPTLVLFVEQTPTLVLFVAGCALVLLLRAVR